MAKKGNNKAPKRKSPRTWAFTDSQTALIREVATKQQEELQPFLQYQQNARAAILQSFRKELGISDDTPLIVDLETLQFTEQS